jgi:5'-AMP-activated protein kinase, catalytic alpha subunit
MKTRGKTLTERYEMGKLLGKGMFGKVHYARDLESNQGVAIKIMDKDRVLKAGLSEQVKHEITTMRLVEHKNIIRLHEVMATRNKIYVIMEYAKGVSSWTRLRGAAGSRKLTHTDTSSNSLAHWITATVEACTIGT